MKILKSTFLIMAICASCYVQAQLPADVNHIIGYGQSLSLGSTDKVLINSSGLSYPNVIMFNNGLRYDTGETDQSMTSFVPLVEAVMSSYAESPSSGFADMFLKTMIAENGAYDENKSLLFRVPGQGGKSITALNKNGASPERYESLVRGIRRGHALATVQGKTFNVPCFTWTQGEQDVYDGMSLATYKNLLIGLRNDIDTDAKAVTSQTNNVKCIMYQTASHNRYFLTSLQAARAKNPYIAVAQYQLAIESNNDFYMATPLYPFDYNSDNVHLRAEYSRLMGAYYGYVAKKVLVDGVDWKPLHPTSYTVVGNQIKIKFYVPVKPLVIDTDWVREIDNYGFNIYRGSNEIGITNVAVSGEDELTITCSGALQLGDRLTYAINGENTGRFIGSRGNIRDSQGDNIQYQIECTTYHMHNWLPIYEETLQF